MRGLVEQAVPSRAAGAVDGVARARAANTVRGAGLGVRNGQRLRRALSANTHPAVGPQQWVEFEYDWQGRRISKKVGAAGSGVATNDLRFVYDGWNLVAILNSDFSLLTSLTWGLDLSGTMQGGGGVGGLLWMTIPAGANAGTYFCAYDGNGNVMALVSAAGGSVAARYEYGPFGELIRATGPIALENPFGFSTKRRDAATGLVLYEYRVYSPDLGRWLSRDPVGEWGGQNFCAFVGNSPINYYDLFGLEAEQGPLTPDGQHIDDQGSIWKDRHNNYVTFHATCPACTRLANVRIDYGNMCGCMYAAFLKGRPSAPTSPGRWPNTPKSQEEYCKHAMWLLGGTFGGVRTPNEREGNCVGRPQEMQAFMRTRLVSPDWVAALYRFVNDLPPASDAASCYMQHTRAYYQCKKCGN